MNGRLEEGETPQERLAAVVISFLRKHPERDWWKLDYADFTETLRPFLERELLHARIREIQQSRTAARDRVILREQTLFQELAMVEGEIAKVGLT